MAISETSICNMALGGIGAKRINNYDDATDTKPEAIQCRLHYEQTRDALLRSHWWRFAAARASLSQDTTDPLFEFDNQFILPNDFLAKRSVFSDNATETENTRYTYAIEGKRLLTDDSSVDLRYTKKVTDPAEFDPLFVEVLVLLLQKKFLPALAGGDEKIAAKIERELKHLMSKVRALDRQEQNTIGRLNRKPWVEAGRRGGGTWRQDRV